MPESLAKKRRRGRTRRQRREARERFERREQRLAYTAWYDWATGAPVPSHDPPVYKPSAAMGGAGGGQ